MIEDNVIDLIQKVRSLDDGPVQITPASEAEMDAFERVHGFRLPGEVRAWFRRCNGASVCPGGLDSLFSREGEISLDWHFKQYPHWKSRGWIPIASDACGDLYIVAKAIEIRTTGTHPVFFLDQADFTRPDYVVASGLWKFLFFLLEDELLREQGKTCYWPFDSERVLAVDPAIRECRGAPLPWEV